MTLSFRHFAVTTILVFLCLITGCDPCRSLAEKICDCEESSFARDNCKRALDTFGGMQSYGNAVQPDQCRAILKDPNCSCLAIKNGQVESCGMTR